MQGTAKIMEKINSLTFQVQRMLSHPTFFNSPHTRTLHNYPDVDSFIVANIASTSIAGPSLTNSFNRKLDTT